VRGRVIVPERSGRQRLMVFLRARGISAPSMNRPATVDANGNFEFRGVAPGSYTLAAAVAERGGSLTARLPVEVGSMDLDNLSVALNPPLKVAGRVRADAHTVANLAGIRVGLRAREPGMFGASPSAAVEADGAFTLSVSPDEYDLVFSGLPEGFYVKAILAGGRDVLLSGLDLSQGVSGAIEVLLSPNAGLAAGVVQNDRQEPAAGATVVLVPQEKERRTVARFYRTAAADEAGRFTFRNLDPGSYRVYGWSEVESGAWFDPDFMQPFENAGEPVTIREGGQHEVKVRLIG
jgi:hypothetical protein